ncbi:uncharacterized protein METZ01_LOCUS143653 [marine metagenome]|uniref:Uncharacterized protein n=1 Tax=marine metagenome TaxID=408172 RepID=A0A381ZNJ5_9ZZZZ
MIKRKPRLKTGLSIKGLGILSSDPGETRTHGQWLKRPLLYQLSYRIKKTMICLEKKARNLLL